MKLHLELNADVEAGLAAQAKARGLSLEVYVGWVLEEQSSRIQSGRQHPSGKSFVELCEPLRGLDGEFERNKSAGRPIDL